MRSNKSTLIKLSVNIYLNHKNIVYNTLNTFANVSTLYTSANASTLNTSVTVSILNTPEVFSYEDTFKNM